MNKRESQIKPRSDDPRHIFQEPLMQAEKLLTWIFECLLFCIAFIA